MFDTTGDKPGSERGLVSGQQNNDYSIRIEYRTVTIHWLLALVEHGALQCYSLHGLVLFCLHGTIYHTSCLFKPVFAYHTKGKLNDSFLLIYKYMYRIKEWKKPDFGINIKYSIQRRREKMQ
jgi:hypothetical protein